MDQPQTKLQMEIIKNGKVLKYVETNTSRQGLAGHFTDTYKDEDGNIHYVDRVANAIKFTTYSRNTGDGNMISFALNFELLLKGLKENCTDSELDKLILKCAHPLNKALDFYKKESPDTYETRFYQAINDKVKEKIVEFTMGQPSSSMISALQRAVEAPRMQTMIALHNAIKLELYNINNPEIEPENK